MISLLWSGMAIAFYVFVTLFTIAVYFIMIVFENRLRTFEIDADL